MSEPPKKTEIVVSLIRAGDFHAALRIAKSFRLGMSEEQRQDIIRGFEAYDNARFWRQIGRDPDTLIQRGRETLLTLYGDRI